MRVRVCYTVDATDEYRRAIACRDGNHRKLATRDRVRRLHEAAGPSLDADIMWEYERCTEGCRRPSHVEVVDEDGQEGLSALCGA